MAWILRKNHLYRSNWWTLYSHKGIVIGTGSFGDKRTSCEHLNYRIIEIIQKTKRVRATWRYLSLRLQWKKTSANVAVTKHSNQKNNANKYVWFMHDPVCVLENDAMKFLWNFEIKTNYLFWVRRKEHFLINKIKMNYDLIDFAIKRKR